ncbi:hypothetical protein GURASL_13640 [Geotalea uraniireducens]|uniref:Phage tail assembly protein n=1 Tax=Geotalea uraniireducens TaxID=351604 RepID=A0ABN6VTB8_9BACT|nr:phage tail assembly protein [Geotalea uraniireducens]BDV42441.1 hypothetical protein GURASL_13640 [Geotalea uraniireducens]
MKITKVEGSKKPLTVESVEIRESLVEDLIHAERISGKTQGFEFLAAVLSQIGTFDGQLLAPEELRRLPTKDFLELAGESGLTDATTSPGTSSTSSEKESGEKSE